jgi:hypothetical protein
MKGLLIRNSIKNSHMMNCIDLSRNLKNEEITVTLKPSSHSFRKYGRSLTGKFVGRLWEERFDIEKQPNKLIALTIQTFSEYVHIPCTEIENISRATYLA